MVSRVRPDTRASRTSRFCFNTDSDICPGSDSRQGLNSNPGRPYYKTSLTKDGNILYKGETARFKSMKNRIFILSGTGPFRPNQFITTVSEERDMPKDEIRTLADGRVFSGRQAYSYALIDSLGTFEDAIQLAADMAGIEGEPRLVRQQRRKMTPFELLFTYDMKEFIETYFSAWPRIQYLMSF